MQPVWQDWVLMLCQIVFILALIPTLRGSSKPEIGTSLTTGATLWVIAVTLATLRLWNGATFTFIAGLLWFVLAEQRRRQLTKW